MFTHRLATSGTPKHPQFVLVLLPEPRILLSVTPGLKSLHWLTELMNALNINSFLSRARFSQLTITSVSLQLGLSSTLLQHLLFIYVHSCLYTYSLLENYKLLWYASPCLWSEPSPDALREPHHYSPDCLLHFYLLSCMLFHHFHHRHCSLLVLLQDSFIPSLRPLSFNSSFCSTAGLVCTVC